MPYEQYLGWMKKHGLLFSTVFGIGQLIKKSRPSDPDCCYYLHCPTFNYTVTPDPTNDRLNAEDYTKIYMNSSLRNDVVLTLSATYPNLQGPDSMKNFGLKFWRDKSLSFGLKFHTLRKSSKWV